MDQNTPESPKTHLLGYSRFAAVFVMALAFLVLLGWAMGSDLLISLHPQYVSMKANTALAFLLAGLSLFFLARRQGGSYELPVSRLLAMLVLLMGLLTLLQYVFSVDFSLDAILFREEAGAIGTYHPGRMAANTAIGFIILGVSLLLVSLHKQWAIMTSQLMALLVALLSLLPLTGYLFGVDSLYGFAGYTEMALHTALAFLVMGTGLLFVQPGRAFVAVITDPGTGGYLSRRLLPLIILAPIVLMWLWVMAERAGWHSLASDISLFSVSLIGVIVFLVWKISASVNQLEAKRRESEEQAKTWHSLMQYIIRHDPSAIAVHDNELRYVFVSERYLQDYRVKEKDIIGKHHYDVFPDIPQEWREVHQRALRGEIITSDESVFPRADGRVDYTRWECRPWHQRDGSIGGIILYTEVITERVRAERQHRETARRLKLVLENAGDGIFGLDHEGRATMVNKAALDMLGYREEELMGEVMHDYHHHRHPDGTPYPNEECAIHQSFRKGQVHFVDDEVFWRKDGSSFPVEYVSTPIAQDGSVTGAVVSFRDITERKQAEKKLQQALKRAEESDRLKTAFLNNMSHEVRTPLNSILGFANLLRDAELTREELDQFVQIINRSGQQLLQIITDIIGMATIEAGQEQLRQAPVDICRMMRKRYEHFAGLLSNERLGFSYLCDLPEEESIVLADEFKLIGVLDKLLDNAFKFTEKGKVSFSCHRRDDLLHFSVTDTGIGIDSRHHEEIFERFNQVTPPSGRVLEGNGLGLSIAKAYVQLMGGEISLESRPARGSVFHFTIPHKPVKEEKEAPDSSHGPKDQLKRKPLILIAEDEDSNFQLLKTILEPAGHEVLRAENGELVLKKVRELPNIDLVLMDIKMPLVDGLEATRLIREERPGLPVIAITAHALEGDRQKALNAGCNDYMAKPIRREALLRKIQSVLGS